MEPTRHQDLSYRYFNFFFFSHSTRNPSLKKTLNLSLFEYVYRTKGKKKKKKSPTVPKKKKGLLSLSFFSHTPQCICGIPSNFCTACTEKYEIQPIHTFIYVYNKSSFKGCLNGYGFCPMFLCI